MGTVQLVTKYPVIAFLLVLFPVKVSIDGAAPQNHKWGVTEFQLPAGTHRIQVTIPYIIVDIGKAVVDVTVAEGQTVVVNYKAPWLVFLPGKIAVSEPGAGEPAPAAA